ncbi:purine-binding chemotaxis protein CheW [Ruficoccus amylovorans]|uniref:Purine-binding chemotaxis protein CheW n=1 Tax=Ruficoccus amylovorans TaxID=1804625 RepID=A0A842HER0_9BACT|nr:chemotaxis protein CheW [Ruficoccus amylovorans]MBC2594528.1 purine-binding chemotaxis protein CheW [Ruficoccus amylovorans]
MLIILFQLGPRRYGLDSQRVVEIVPAMPVREVPGTPAAVKGIFEYRGKILPVIDLCQLTVGRPAEIFLSTRYLVVEANGGSGQLVALLAEKVTDTLTVDEAALLDPGLRPPEAPHLGRVLKDARGELVQCVEVEELITPEIRALLRQCKEVPA